MNDAPMPHILVVDDDREIRDLLAKFLSRNGCRVTTASRSVASYAPTPFFQLSC